MFDKMNNASSTYSSRVMCLTSQTSNALSVTLRGVIGVTKMLLDEGISYVLTGDVQSDRLEGEFGIFRQLNGGNYYMSAEHCQNCLKLQRLKLYSRLENDISIDHTASECCSQPLNEEELDNLDNFSEASKLNEIERSSLYYISGYICHKEQLQSEPAPTYDIAASEFTTNVSRGKLSHPLQISIIYQCICFLTISP